MDSFPNAELIWTPQQLHARLGDSTLTLVDVRPTHEAMRGIIPGAAHFDLYGLGVTRTTPELFGEWVNMMRSQLALRGAGTDQTVVFYEGDSGMRAARGFWLMEYMGHKDVHVLDGGVKAWLDAGYELTQEMAAPKPHSLKMTLQEDLFISADQLNQRLGDVVPLDTRSHDEHLGVNKRGGPRGGTIPGAAYVEYTEAVGDDGRFKAPAELLALYEAQGVLRDKAIVPF